MGYDVIGDIHGQAAKLEALLRKMGYTRAGNSWKPPSGRMAVFVGDMIDRGPEQLKVLNIVRSMRDAGDAHVVLGNHEFNAIGFVTESHARPGTTLRPDNAKNRAQHAEFLAQVGEGSALHRDLVHWFKSLPPALDLGEIRVVHAWWHQPHVDLVHQAIGDQGFMDDAFVQRSMTPGTSEWTAMDGLTKGLEVRLPPGHSFVDHAGIEREHVRTKWWHEEPRTFRDVAILEEHQRHRMPVASLPDNYQGAPVRSVPVFVGHYWMSGEPDLQSPKVVCTDYSAAKDGPLVAYRWTGEEALNAHCFVSAG